MIRDSFLSACGRDFTCKGGVLTSSRIFEIYEGRAASMTVEEPKGEGQKYRMPWKQVLSCSSGSWKLMFQEHVSFRPLEDGERGVIRGDTHRTIKSY